MPAVLYEKKGAVAYITLTRPEVHNALNPEAAVLLAEAWQDYAQDDNLHAVILTGAGNKAFTAGADLAKLVTILIGARQPQDEWDKKIAENKKLVSIAFLRHFEMYKPVIVAINGYCAAGGAEMILACDIRIAAKHATFWWPEVSRAIIPATGSMARLPRQIPLCKAMELLMTGDRIDAEEAYRIGLINYVVPEDQLMQQAEKIANKIAENGPLAVRKIKETVLKSSGLPLEEAFKLEDENGRIVARSEDAREGSRSWIEKRKPVYKGK